MIGRTLKLLTVVALMGLAWTDSSAQAQGAGQVVAPTIVVLDVGTIRREAASVASIREQIVKFQNELQTEVQKEQEALRTAQNELAKKQTLLAPEAFAEERRKFEQRVIGVQQMVQGRRRALEESQNGAMGKVEEALNTIVVGMAKERGYAIVLRSSQVVLVDDVLNITKEVLTKLNATLPSVKVDAPKK